MILAVTCFFTVVSIPFVSYLTRDYADGTPNGFKYAELSMEHLDFLKESVSSEPATEMMGLKPVIVDSRSLKDVTTESEDYIYEYR